jgi:hypothetical protein
MRCWTGDPSASPTGHPTACGPHHLSVTNFFFPSFSEAYRPLLFGFSCDNLNSQGHAGDSVENKKKILDRSKMRWTCVGFPVRGYVGHRFDTGLTPTRYCMSLPSSLLICLGKMASKKKISDRWKMRWACVGCPVMRVFWSPDQHRFDTACFPRLFFLFFWKFGRDEFINLYIYYIRLWYTSLKTSHTLWRGCNLQLPFGTEPGERKTAIV